MYSSECMGKSCAIGLILVAGLTSSPLLSGDCRALHYIVESVSNVCLHSDTDGCLQVKNLCTDILLLEADLPTCLHANNNKFRSRYMACDACVGDAACRHELLIHACEYEKCQALHRCTTHCSYMFTFPTYWCHRQQDGSN